MSRRKPTLGAVLLAAAAAAAGALVYADGEAPAPQQEPRAAAGEAYNRDAFGDGWADTDQDGCDTRAEVLLVQLEDPVLRPADEGGCLVLSGRLVDPYTGVVGVVDRSEVDVDHLVALGDAWASGADAWTDEQRGAYANDPAVLVATDASENRRKGDRGPNEWSPPDPAAVCWYVTTYEEIKVTYELVITPEQQDAIDDGCPS